MDSIALCDSLGEGGVQAGRTFQRWAASITEEFDSREALTFSISFGGIEQNGQAGSIKLIKELAPVWDRRL
jgi:hypothetical protein